MVKIMFKDFMKKFEGVKISNLLKTLQDKTSNLTRVESIVGIFSVISFFYFRKQIKELRKEIEELKSQRGY